MNKIIFTSLLMITSTPAFGTTILNCGSFAKTRIPGATTYEVEFSSQNYVTLIRKTWEGHTSQTRTKLPKIFQGIDGAAYKNNMFKVVTANARVHLENLSSNDSIECR